MNTKLSPQKFRTVILTISLSIAACASKPNETKDPVPTDSKVEAKQMVQKSEVRFQAAGTNIVGTMVDAGVDTPVVVFVAGSGPTDRNWESPLIPGDNGSARLLADALAENGISSVRYDKRGTGKTELPKRPLKWDDYLDEIAGAIDTIRQTQTLKSSDVYLLGHSEGAAHVLRYVTTRQHKIAGLILVNGAGRALGDVVVSQIDKQLETAGVSEKDRMMHRQSLTTAITNIAAGKEVDPVAASPYPGVQNLVKVFMAENARPFSNEILVWDPVQTIKKYDGKVIILQGDRDIQIDVALDANALKTAQPNAELTVIAGADHVMKFLDKPREEVTAQDGLIYNEAGRTLAPGVVEAISKFIR